MAKACISFQMIAFVIGFVVFSKNVKAFESYLAKQFI